MVHEKGESNHAVHKLAFDTFQEAADKAMKLKLYGAGQDLLKTAFAGNIRGMGPGVAEMEIEERASDPIVVFAADKTSAGAFNFPLFSILADPLTTAGLVIDPNMSGGYKFEVMGTVKNTKVVMRCPEEMYDLLALVGTVQRYMVSRVWRAHDDLMCVSGSVTRLSLIAGKYVGKDDHVMIMRASVFLNSFGKQLVLLILLFNHIWVI